MPSPPALLPGLAFPVCADGTRRSTPAGARLVAAALRALNQGRAAQAAEAEVHWRRRYPSHFRQLVEAALTDPALALASAEAGLQTAWQTLCWIDREGGGERRLAQALEQPEGWPLATLTLKGQGAPQPRPWALPYQGRLLEGEALKRQLLDWVENGILEASAAKALGRCLRHPEWFDLSDRHLVLLGAASELGPLRWLSHWRAKLIAVDAESPEVWARIADTIHHGNATLHLPLRGSPRGADWLPHAGADLLTDAPRIAAWLRSFDLPLDLAALAHQDGERHVRVALAMDMVISSLLAAQPASSLAFLGSPADVYAVPELSAQAAQRRHAARPLLSRSLHKPLHLAAGERYFQPNVEALLPGPAGQRYGVVDGLLLEQGPNEALAKRLQQWRALSARAHGHRVSFNIAPPTRSAAALKQPALAAGMAGAVRFGVEVFEPETSSALMAALWVHDLRTDQASADPRQPLAHPFELFMDQACHGGLWCTPYRPRSALPFAALLGWWRRGAMGG